MRLTLGGLHVDGMNNIPTERIVTCPGCGGPSVYASRNRYRPFCGERCKNHDLGAWASEEHRVPDPTPPDDFDVGATPLQ